MQQGPGGIVRPGSTGPRPPPLGFRPGMPPQMNSQQGGMQAPQRNGSLTPGPSGQQAAMQGRASPRPAMPPMQAGQPQQGRPMPPAGIGAARPQMGMPPQQQQPRQQQQQQPQNHIQSPTDQMAQMSLNTGNENGMTSPPPQDGMAGGPSRTKRSARAYHQQEEAQAAQQGYSQDGYGQQQQQHHQHQQTQQQAQPSWQSEAAARVAALEHQLNGPGGDDSALDQMPGQRNQISQSHMDSNNARMAQAQHQRGPLPAQGGAAGSFSQQMPMMGGPVGPQTPGPGSHPSLAPVGNQPGMPPMPDNALANAQQHQGGINQPPHSAGQRFAGPKSKIDPDQIPAPVEAQDADQEYFDREWFATCGRGGLPLSTTEFGAVDQGESIWSYLVRFLSFSLT